MTKLAGAEQFVKEVAVSLKVLFAIMVRLNSRPEVRDVRHGVNLKDYPDGPTVEAYVEAVLDDSVVVYWWLDLRLSDGKWLLDVHIGRNDEAGMDNLRTFPKSEGRTVEELHVALERVVAELAAPANDDFVKLPTEHGL